MEISQKEETTINNTANESESTKQDLKEKDEETMKGKNEEKKSESPTSISSLSKNDTKTETDVKKESVEKQKQPASQPIQTQQTESSGWGGWWSAVSSVVNNFSETTQKVVGTFMEDSTQQNENQQQKETEKDQKMKEKSTEQTKDEETKPAADQNEIQAENKEDKFQYHSVNLNSYPIRLLSTHFLALTIRKTNFSGFSRWSRQRPQHLGEFSRQNGKLSKCILYKKKIKKDLPSQNEKSS